MSVEKVQEYLKKYGVENRIIVLEESSATVELTVKELEEYSMNCGWVDVCKNKEI